MAFWGERWYDSSDGEFTMTYYKLSDNSAVITKVIKVAGGPDKYKMFSSGGFFWYDAIENIVGNKEEITEAEYRELGDSIQVAYAAGL